MITNNIFEEMNEVLTQDIKSLTKKYHKRQEDDDFNGAMNCIKLLKDSLSLIQEYKLSICKQNRIEESGTNNHKIQNYTQKNINYYNKNKWYEIFENAIISGQSLIVNTNIINERNHRNTGKSYALTKLCSNYDCIAVSKFCNGIRGIENNSIELNIKIHMMYGEDILEKLNLRENRNKIIIIDEGNCFSDDDVTKLTENHIVIGFKG